MLWSALVLLIGLLALAVPVAAGLGILGIVLSEIYSRLPLTLAIGEVAWATSNNFLLVAIPFFVLLGEILLRSGMAERMYNALVLWVPWLPGGLMHSNIAACAMFECISPPGSHGTHRTRALYMRSAMPERSRISPSNTKNGMATSRKLFDVAQATSPIASVSGSRE